MSSPSDAAVELLTQGASARAPTCRAIWTHPLPSETTAPEARLVHARAVSFAAPTRLHRVGFREGEGYFKCGWQPEVDWVVDACVRTFDGADWQTVATATDLARPAPGETHWITVKGQPTQAAIVELRRSGVDGWWPGWNLATTGVLLEGEPPTTTAPDAARRAVNGCTARFVTPFLDVSFALDRPAWTHLGIDGTGSGQTATNLLRMAPAPSPAAAAYDLVDYLACGPLARPVTGGVGWAGAHAGCEVEVDNTGVAYEVELLQGLTYWLRWDVLDDRLVLHARRRNDRPRRAWTSSAWQFALDTEVTASALLGEVRRAGEAGRVGLPALLHAPRHGSLHLVATEGDASARLESLVRAFTNTIQLKLAETALPDGDYLLPEGEHELRLELRVCAPELVDVPAATPEPVRDMLRRTSVTALPYRPDTATFSNNGNSMHAPICLDMWGELAARLQPTVAGVRPMELQRDSLDRWLTGAPGYASGGTAAGAHVMEDEYLMTGAAALLGVAIQLEATSDSSWLELRADAVGAQLAAMRSRDCDDDGLIETSVRRGLPGEHQWGSSWFETTSFGWKDAVANALLYRALVLLDQQLPRLGHPELADGLTEWAARLRLSYVPCFLNPETGWLGGWRDIDGVLHDYAFLFVNGAAVTAGLLDDAQAEQVVSALWLELQRVGFTDFSLGLPGNLWSVPDELQAEVMHGHSFPHFLNGGATHCQARHFVEAMYAVGMRAEADEVLTGLASGLAEARVYGGRGSGLEWTTWDGQPCGYEGQLCDQFGILVTAIDRYVLDRW